MNDSIGNSMLLSIVLFIVSAIMLMFVAALAYSKAYKAKEIVIENLESYGSITNAQAEITESLTTLGYQINDDFTCPKITLKVKYEKNNKETTQIATEIEATKGVGFKYCIYEIFKIYDYETKLPIEKYGYYYRVYTYTQFKFPIIEDVISAKVSGETKILGKTYDYD